MNNLKIFNNAEFGSVRGIEIDGEPWLVGKDVAAALGYKNPQEAIRNHVADEDKGVRKILTPGGKQNIPIINESGLYSLIMSSKLSSAKKFKHWVTSEVLPSIRKHGAYMTPETLENMISSPDFGIRLLTALKEERAKSKKLEEKIEIDAPKVKFAETMRKSEDNILIRDMAKLLCEKEINIGEKRLFELLRKHGILLKDNAPYQRYIDRGYFVVRESAYNTPQGVRLARTPLVTPAGQPWLERKVRSWLDEENSEIA